MGFDSACKSSIHGWMGECINVVKYSLSRVSPPQNALHPVHNFSGVILLLYGVQFVQVYSYENWVKFSE